MTETALAIKIITKQITMLMNDQEMKDIVEVKESENILKLPFIFNGPKNTPWDNCKISGIINFPNRYPYEPPDIKFTCDVFHPNIYPDTGKICLSILNTQPDEFNYFDNNSLWIPTYTISKIFIIIQHLFIEPNVDSPANVDANSMYLKDKNKFEKYIKQLFTLTKNN